MQLLETRCNCHKLLVICIRGLWRENGPSVVKNFIINWGFFFPGSLVACPYLSLFAWFCLFLSLPRLLRRMSWLVVVTKNIVSLESCLLHFIQDWTENTLYPVFLETQVKVGIGTGKYRAIRAIGECSYSFYEFSQILMNISIAWIQRKCPSLRKHCYRENETRAVSVFLGPSYMVSATRDNPPPKASLSSVYIWKRGSCRPSQS